MFDALIFDFDGTILDTETPECASWEALYEENGQVFPRWRFLEAVGRGYDLHIFEPLAFLQAQIGGDSDALKARQRELFTALLETHSLREGVDEWLACATERGLGRAIASSSPRVWIERHLPRLGLSASFQAITTRDDVGPGRTKPHPDLFLAACAALKVAPERAVVIEDSQNGVLAARAAGCFTIAIPNPMTAQMDFSQADRVATSLAGLSLPELLERGP